MRVKLNKDEIHQVLTTNLQDWKKYANIPEAKDLNNALTLDDLCVVRSSAFYDDIHDACLDVSEILDRHFLSPDLEVFERETFILIHNIYNN